MMKKIFTIFSLAFFIALLLPLVTRAGGGFYDTEVMTNPNNPTSAYTTTDGAGSVSDTNSGSDINGDSLAAAGTTLSAGTKTSLWILGIFLVGLMLWGFSTSKKHQIPYN